MVYALALIISYAIVRFSSWATEQRRGIGLTLEFAFWSVFSVTSLLACAVQTSLYHQVGDQMDDFFYPLLFRCRFSYLLMQDELYLVLNFCMFGVCPTESNIVWFYFISYSPVCKH